MNVFVAYILIMDMATALIYLISLLFDKKHRIEVACYEANVSVTKYVIVGAILGFILLPISIIGAILETKE